MDRASYRIIDANFNRAREALRVTEEYCRFCLDSKPLAETAKSMRHQLSSAAAKIDPGRLIAARDTEADVGTDITVTDQLHRQNLTQSFTAAAKRLSEALRVLAETAQPINEESAKRFEQLRYKAYTFEKQVMLFADASQRFKKVKLYVLISNLPPVDVLAMTQYCIAGGADCIQLRLKEMSDSDMFALAEQFTKLCSEKAVISIINDRPDIAIACGADGVHLGQDDLPARVVTKLQQRPMITGISTHSLEQLKQAIDQRPTYAALGPVFTTETKPSAKAVGLEYVRRGAAELQNTGIASIAIGGIDQNNVESVMQAGASAVAVSAAVTRLPDPTAACRKLKEKINSVT